MRISIAWPTGVRLPRDDPPRACDDWLRPPRDDEALLREDDAPLRDEPLDPPRLDDEDPPRPDDDAPRPDDDAPRPEDPPVFFAALRDCEALLLLAAPRPELLRPRVLALLVLRVRVAFMSTSPLSGRATAAVQLRKVHAARRPDISVMLDVHRVV